MFVLCIEMLLCLTIVGSLDNYYILTMTNCILLFRQHEFVFFFVNKI